ncbi:peptide chain release factor 1 [Candidatus Parcubacteria bacterium]|nr:peptide chain release factor 1 [Patescibacteria group bacterium]MCG2694335.1 peptide chain release factor 1 [Candidatus Parcubacteria bacterium]
MDKEKIIKTEEQLKELEGQLSEPAIFSNPEKFKKLNKEYAKLKETIELMKRLELIEVDIETAKKDPELESELPNLEKEKKEIEESLSPKNPLDKKSIIIEIRAGTGGDEAALFSAELFRMYSHFAENMGWDVKILSSNQIGIGGFKEIIAKIDGEGVYGWLKYESGVHRVQRIPETEKSGRIHTSAATVAVLPEVDEIEFKIDPKDLEIKTSTSQGPGGQSVNTTYSAIILTHVPTGLIVKCQDQKSQQQNKLRAIEIMRARLFDIEQEKRKKEEREMRKSQIGTGDRSEKIRTYNYPQDRITDHRIKESWHNMEKILSGEIKPIIEKLKEADRQEGK